MAKSIRISVIGGSLGAAARFALGISGASSSAC